jgi:hypothetical protein
VVAGSFREGESHKGSFCLLTEQIFEDSDDVPKLKIMLILT